MPKELRVSKRPRRRGRSGDVEWVGGVHVFPGVLPLDDGTVSRLGVLLWVGDGGVVLGSEVGPSDALVADAADLLQSTIEEPALGQPHAPTRVRVSSPDFAEALRAGHPDIDVVVGPTPEMDLIIEAMIEFAGRGDDGPYLLAEAEPAAAAAFCRAMADLYRAQPWDVVPTDRDLIGVRIEALEVDGVLCVIGQQRQNFGVVLFPGEDEFEAYIACGEHLEDAGLDEVPPHLSLNFDHAEALPDVLRGEIEEHRWKVAGKRAYPWMIPVQDGEVRAPTAREVVLAEAIALALPRLLEQSKELVRAFEGDGSISRTVTVATSAGELEVVLDVQCWYRTDGDGALQGELEDLLALEAEGEIDPESCQDVQERLLRRFRTSTEASEDDVAAAAMLMDMAAGYLGVTIASLGPLDLQETIFEVYPRKVSIDASVAASIIDSTRRFYGFLDREYGLPQAAACLHVLGRGAAERLEEALGDRSKFGMAKSVVMAGKDAGFDVDTKEGLKAWLRQCEGRPLPPSVNLGVGGMLPFGAAEDQGPVAWVAPKSAGKSSKSDARKKKRKAAKRSRRKNR